MITISRIAPLPPPPRPSPSVAPRNRNLAPPTDLPQVAKLAQQAVCLHAGRSRRRHRDWEDVEQEVVLHVLQQIAHQDQAHGNRAAFISRVAQHKLISHHRAQRAACRNKSRIAYSLDAAGGSPLNPGVSFAQQLSSTAHIVRLGLTSRTAHEQWELATDIGEVIRRLTPAQRVLCRELSQGSITTVSRKLGIPRSTLYARIAEIRSRFSEAQLQDYFTESAPSQGR